MTASTSREQTTITYNSLGVAWPLVWLHPPLHYKVKAWWYTNPKSFLKEFNQTAFRNMTRYVKWLHLHPIA